MSDRFDAELKKALNESTSQSLAGWEFTPSMRQAVLKRIAEEKAAPPAPAPTTPVRRVSPRSYAWAAAAAAAFVVGINVISNLNRTGDFAEHSASPSPIAASVPPKEAKREVPAQAGSTENAPTEAIKGGLGAGPANAQASGAESGSKPEMAAATTGQAHALADRTAAAPVPAAPARIHLVLPESNSVAMKAAPNHEQSAGIAAFTAPAPPPSAMVRVGANNAVRTPEAVQFFDAWGVQLWEKQLPEGWGPVSAWNGQVATTSGSDLYLFDAAGQQVRRQNIGGAELFAIGPDGRVAAVTGSTLSVYDATKRLFQAEGVTQNGLAFGPDGTLAVVMAEADGPYLQLFGRDGSPLSRAKLNGWGMGIAFAGDVVVVGGEAFHRSGQPLWQTPFPAQQSFTLGPDGPVVAHDGGQSISLLRAADGTEIWTAQHPGLQTIAFASSDAGDRLAVVAALDDGAAVWVLDQAGGLLLSERLPEVPSSVAVEGDRLYLLMAGGLQNRALPPR